MSGRPTELQYVETPLLKQLEKLGWKTIALSDAERNDPAKSFRTSFAEVILTAHVKAALLRLNPWLTEVQADDLCIDLQNYDYPKHNIDKLLENNQAMFKKITEGLFADNEETGEINCPVRLIDWTDIDSFDPENTDNDYLAISQFKVKIPGKGEHIIPDVILFINGLPLVVIECKAPDITNPIAEGIEQLLRYQNRRGDEIEGVPELFFYNQILVSSCYHFARYSSITGGKSHFIEWKDPYPYTLTDIHPLGAVSGQDIIVCGMLEPSHLLDIIQNYIVFLENDEGKTIKIIPRYMQYRGARKIIERLRSDKTGGTLWHTQGSGKSLTMMFVIRKMYNSADLNDYKIVLLIDRKDLQDQLYKTSAAIRYTVHEAGSIANLKTLIKNTASDVSVAMIHKFGEDKNKNGVFPILNTSDRILVMIDEAHRSEYSDLAANMWRAMPNSVKVAFTGTPIIKTTETFGGYIDTYTMRKAVADKVIVDIIYEGYGTSSDISDRDAMNRDFVDVFGYMETEEQQKIMGKYTWRGYLEAEEIIRAKAAHMLKHYIDTVFANGFKAQVVAVSREAAHRYKVALTELLAEKIAELKQGNPNNVDIDRLSKMKVACIISTSANDAPHLKQYGNESDNKKIIDGFKAPFGKNGKKGGDGNYGIIVVADMLLTGFDAPIEQVMYLDDVMRGHNLLQAVARVNRTCGENKKCGYVVDYAGTTKHLRKALADYTDEDAAEIVSGLKDPSQDLDALNTAYNAIILFIKDKLHATLDDSVLIIEELAASEPLRDEFNDLFSALSILYDRVLPNPVALDYKDDFRQLAFVRQSVANITRDPRLSMKDASEKVRAIIEEYLEVKGVSLKIPPIPLLSDDFLENARKSTSDRAVCEEIKYAIREYINKNASKDPEYFERLSERLDTILNLFEENWEELRKSLESFRQEIIEGRKREQTFGYEPEHEMPFFALLKKELYGNVDYSELSLDDFEALKDLTNDVLERFKTDTKMVNFWNNEALQRTLRTFIINKLIGSLLMERIPTLYDKRNAIATMLIDLDFHHYGGNTDG